MQKARFFRYFIIVALVHVIVISATLVIPGCREMFRKKPPVVMPVEFLVEVSQPEQAPREPVVSTPAKPKPEPKKEPKKKPVPKKRERPKIEKGKRITRTPKPDPNRKKLTEEEIKKLLDAGAKPSDRTSIPDEDARCLDIIRRKLHSSWTQPSSAAFGLSAELRIGLRSGGAVTSHTIVRSSGSAEFDTSVMRAGETVRTITGLTSGFIKRYPTVTIEFRVE